MNGTIQWGFTFVSLALAVAVQFCSANYVATDQNLTLVPNDISLSEIVIDLGKNDLTSLGPYEFSSYVNLTELILQENMIAAINETAFSSTILSKLDLVRNKITDFPDLSSISPTLTTLILNYNPIETIDDGYLNLPVMKSLLMYHFPVPLSRWLDLHLVGKIVTGSWPMLMPILKFLTFHMYKAISSRKLVITSTLSY